MCVIVIMLKNYKTKIKTLLTSGMLEGDVSLCYGVGECPVNSLWSWESDYAMNWPFGYVTGKAVFRFVLTVLYEPIVELLIRV